MPGNQLVERVRAWHDGMRWRMPDKNRPDRAPSWLEICEAVMGADAVQIARGDFKAEKSATKLMREMQLRLLHCTVNGAALPGYMVGAAFARAVSPLSFTDGKGKWQGFLWARCVATACAMIRRHLQVGREPLEVTPELDMTLRRRDYLYGRLLGVAYRLEQAVNAQPEEKWSSVRMMTRFVQRPAETWPLLYESLLPCLSALGDRARASRNPDDRRWNARLYQRLFGQIERLFTLEDRADTRPLSYLFLVGFHTQRMSLRLDREMRPYAPPATRDELYGCLLAIADDCEWNAERADGDVVSARDGHTGAMALTRAFARAPSTAWQRIHDGLIPYLESAGVREAGRVQRLIARVEQGFAPQERASDRPLGSLFLHGYLSMRLALAQHSLDMETWKPERPPAPQPNTREAAFGALLALENDVERRALDLDAPGEENRPSNTMRFLTRAARRPCEVWDYLSARMKPYAGKRWLGASVTDTANALRERIAQSGWDTDEPLRPQYLHDFYLYSGALYAGTPEHREHDRKDD